MGPSLCGSPTSLPCPQETADPLSASLALPCFERRTWEVRPVSPESRGSAPPAALASVCPGCCLSRGAFLLLVVS